MNFQFLTQNQLVVAILSSIVTAISILILASLFTKARSFFGVFSGQYIGITGNLGTNQFLVEDIRCRHIGNKLVGKIQGVTVLRLQAENNEYEEIQSNTDKYKFRGFVDERVFVISYGSVIPAIHSSGSIALAGESSGRIFKGIWAGLAQNSIVQNKCMWIKLPKKISVEKNRMSLISHAMHHLRFDVTAPLEFQFIEKGPQKFLPTDFWD